MFACQCEKLDNKLLKNLVEEIENRKEFIQPDVIVECLQYFTSFYSISDSLLNSLFTELSKKSQTMNRFSVFTFLKLRIQGCKVTWVRIARELIDKFENETTDSLNFEEALVLRSCLLEIHAFDNKKLSGFYDKLNNKLSMEMANYESTGVGPKLNDYECIEYLIDYIQSLKQFSSFWLTYFENNIETFLNPTESIWIKKNTFTKLLEGFITIFAFESSTIITNVG